jgi:hypothetical protein
MPRVARDRLHGRRAVATTAQDDDLGPRADARPLTQASQVATVASRGADAGIARSRASGPARRSGAGRAAGAERRSAAVTVASSPGPAPLVRDVLLRDGTSLRLLAATPADFEDISAFFTGLSRQSRLRSFHGLGPTDAVARAEANASGADRLALIGGRDGSVVAVGRYTGLREPV